MFSDELLEKADSVFNSREYEKSREIYLRVAQKADSLNLPKHTP